MLDGNSRGSGVLDRTCKVLESTCEESALEGTGRDLALEGTGEERPQEGAGEEPALAGIGEERPQGGAGEDGLWGWAPTHPLICHQQAQGTDDGFLARNSWMTW